MNRRSARTGCWFALAAFALLLSRCDSGGDSSDGKSSWLEDCSKDSDCTGDTSCHCGVCTKSCAKASECAGLASSTCVEAAESSATDCRVGVFAQSGVCLPACKGDGECPGPSGTMRCESGICIPAGAAVGDDGGVVQPVPDGGMGGAANTGGAAASGGTAGTGGVVNTGGVATGGAATGGVSTASGGATSGGTTGKPNPYGGPSAYTDGFAATCAPEQAVSVPSGCASFNLCKHPCEDDKECPAVAGGSARPVCGFGRYCELLCEDGLTCATGMTCVQTPGGRYCMWQTREPDCDISTDPCLRRPRPASCPEVCAEESVACSDALGVKCCEGLTCGPQNFCVKGGN